MDETNDMNMPEIKIRLEPAPDDLAERDPAFQGELHTLSVTLHSGGVRYAERAVACFSTTMTGYLLAEFIVKELGPAVIGVLGTALGAWINGRSGRKVRLKVGDIEIEGRTVNEIDQLLQRAQALQVGQESPKNEA
jgi:hypothetical protein